jgi:hypothetical protein
MVSAQSRKALAGGRKMFASRDLREGILEFGFELMTFGVWHLAGAAPNPDASVVGPDFEHAREVFMVGCVRV